jgi:quercetin dioxygenase-like cupin family protein
MTEQAPAEPVILDAPRIAAEAANRLAASLNSSDLNVNLLVLDPPETIAEHVNSEVDVLIVGIAGQGEITVDDEPFALIAGQAMVIAKGARRAICPITDRFAYLTCHRTRAGLWPKPSSPKRQRV